MGNDQTSSTNLYVPALAGLYDGLSGLAYPFIRVVTGLWAMPHGAGKLFGWFGLSVEGTAGFFAKIGLEPALPRAYLVGEKSGSALSATMGWCPRQACW